MRTGQVLNCFSYNGISTGISGIVIGLYDFGTGSGINGRNLVYNCLFPTGANFSGNQIFGPSIPLISVSSPVSGYNFTGSNTYRAGFNVSGDFSVILDIDYNGCSRNTFNQSQVLLTSKNSPTGATGTFILGINDVNHLYIQTDGYTSTLKEELKSNNLVYFSLSNRNSIEFGLFDVHNQNLISEQITLPRQQSLVNTLYVGGFLNNSDTSFTGYSGQIYHSILTNKALEISGVKNICNCIFATGQSSGSGAVTGLIIPTVTGYLFSGFRESVITGMSSYTATVTKSDGSIVSLIFPSGLTGLVQTQEVATVLTGISIISLTGTPTINFLNDNRLNNYLRYNLEFDLPLESGDYLEIYTYQNHNSKINNVVRNLKFPKSNEYVQLIGNGLVETNGVDYSVERGVITGFIDDDILISDFLTGTPLISAFSGWWNRSKIQMSGGVFFPPSSQFNETVDTGRILITGISGQRFSPNYDFYINGQKLISGIHYLLIDASVSGWFGGQTGLTVGVFNPNLLPDFSAIPLYAITGGLPTGIGEIEDSELTALPTFPSFTRRLVSITGTTRVYSGVTGFSEQVWVNGLRQTHTIDYLRNYDCTQNSGFKDFPDLPFKFFDTEIQTGFYNI